MSRLQFSHFFEMAVRWGDLDALGHVNNVQLIRYLESGRVAYCSEVLGIHFTKQLKAGWILAELQVTFLNQLRYPATIQVATRITAMGNSSAQLDATVFHNNTDQRILESKGVFVWFDYEVQKSVTIPEKIRRAIVDYEQLE